MDCLELETNQITLSSCISLFSTALINTKITTASHENVSVESGMKLMLQILIQCRKLNGTVFIAGNGGSAAIASHAVIDFLNMARMKATAMLDPAVTTCISNDYGYEHI